MMTILGSIIEISYTSIYDHLCLNGLLLYTVRMNTVREKNTWMAMFHLVTGSGLGSSIIFLLELAYESNHYPLDRDKNNIIQMILINPNLRLLDNLICYYSSTLHNNTPYIWQELDRNKKQ
jgi:hypothetical protein